MKMVKISYFRAKWADWAHFGSRLPVHGPWGVHQDQRAHTGATWRLSLAKLRALRHDWRAGHVAALDWLGGRPGRPSASRGAFSPPCSQLPRSTLRLVSARAWGAGSAGAGHVAQSRHFGRCGLVLRMATTWLASALWVSGARMLGPNPLLLLFGFWTIKRAAIEGFSSFFLRPSSTGIFLIESSSRFGIPEDF